MAKAPTVPVDANLGEMLNWAIRYALGRSTYAVGDTCDYVSKLVGVLDNRTVCCALRDISEQKFSGYGYGDRCDEERWMCLKAELETELKRRGIDPWPTI